MLPDLLAHRLAEDRRGRALVVHGGEALDYEGWYRRSGAVASGLAASGVAPGQRVALVFDNARWTDYGVAYLAVLQAGAVAVPLGPRFTGAELERVLTHCGAGAVVGPADLLTAVPPGPWRVASMAEVEGQDSGPPPPSVLRQPDDLAEILYTSGTTGTPKGVAVSSASLLFHELPSGVAGSHVPARICFLHAFPVGSNAGQEVLRMPLRRAGRTAVVLPLFDPESLCAAVAEHQVTRLQLVPAMAQVLLDSGAPDRFDLSSIERITLSSASVPPRLLARLGETFPGATLCNAYALTESGTARTLLEDAEARPGSVGRPVGGTEVRIVDGDDAEVPVGSTGEIWLRRPGAPRREYYRDPAASAAAFAGDWLRTGDLGHLDEDGHLYIDGRKKDLVISGGLNVSPVEVENVLHDHPAVADVAVFGLDHDVLGQEVAAAVVLGAPATVRELQAFARARLAEYKVPHRLVVVDELPRNAAGKVLKRELPAMVEGVGGGPVRAEPVVSPAAPDGPLQRSVLAVWQEVLGLEVIGVDDDFFAIGGHSLAAAQVAARLQDELGVELPITAVFETPTVAELAAQLAPLVESHRLTSSVLTPGDRRNPGSAGDRTGRTDSSKG